MPSYSWAKLWIDTLDDHKVGMLSDHLWRRFFEFVLLAKEIDQDGYLPPIAAIAWRLRDTPEAIEADLLALAEADGGEGGPGLVQLVDGCWHVTNFAKRQEKPMSDAQRKANQRERDRKTSRRGHRNVTPRDTDQEAESDQESEEDQDQHHPPAREPVDNPVDNSPAPPLGDDDDSLSLDDDEDALYALYLDLVEAGMTDGGARRVVDTCDGQRVRAWLAYVRSNGRIENPGGYLWHVLTETDETAPRVRAPPGERQDKAGRRRYVEGEYADQIKH